MKTQLHLEFKDLKTNEKWSHPIDSWILFFCNFNSNIHPSQLKPEQQINVKASNGNDVEIKCVKVKYDKTR